MLNHDLRRGWTVSVMSRARKGWSVVDGDGDGGVDGSAGPKRRTYLLHREQLWKVSGRELRINARWDSNLSK